MTQDRDKLLNEWLTYDQAVETVMDLMECSEDEAVEMLEEFARHNPGSVSEPH
jgi:hypothetical protein